MSYLYQQQGKARQMSNTLTIQKVNGLIKRSPVINVSKKYPSSAKSVRSTGLYARKNGFGEIFVGYSTGGYKFEIARSQSELQKFYEFATAEGYALSDSYNNEFVIEKAN